jgi:iron-sulfur cluster repair protein YtfE (RIC family)
VKRHDALASLSRDHHHALVIAQRLKRASGASAADARQAFLEYWRADGQRHFREEEDILLPSYAGHGDVEAPIVARVLIDHVRIRRLADELAADTAPIGVLHALGEQLGEHVRREERELFPLIEQALPEAELARLLRLLT